MADIVLTPAQLRALDVARSAAVTAGAGSGKTSVLVLRYVKALECDSAAGVRNVLAITFTERAAAEMKGRARDAIERKIAAGENPARWRPILDDFDRAAISTIHSFCASLLREHPIEAGVDPLFDVLDDVGSSLLRDRAAADALQAAAEEGGQPARDAEAVLRRFGRRTTHEALLLLLDRHEAADGWARRFANADPGEIQRIVTQSAEEVRRLRAKALFHPDRIARLDAVSCSNAGDRLEQLRREALDRLAWAAANPDHPDVLGVLAFLSEIKLNVGGKAGWPECGRDGCKELLKAIRDDAKALAGLTYGEVDANAAPALRGLAALCLRAKALYERAKGDGRVLDFDDLQLRALGLLRDDRGGIRAELHRQFHAVLVDEFQDTDATQWEIIRQVVASPDGTIPPGRLFIVGDPKQSIYGFRNADVRVFSAVASTIIEPSDLVEMDDNFRAAPAPIAFVNRVMAGLMGASGESFDPPYRELVGRRTDALPGSVTLLLARRPDPQDGEDDESAKPIVDAHEMEADMAARQIAWFIRSQAPVWDRDASAPRPARWSDAAILMRSRTRLALFEEALRRHDIPFAVLGGLGLFEQQEVLDLASVLRFLLHQGDNIALAAVLRSPLAGLSDDALHHVSRAQGGTLWAKLQAADESAVPGDAPAMHRARLLLHKWLRRARRLPTAELLAAVVEESGAWGAVAAGERGRQAVANIQKIIAIARGLPDLAAFVEHLNRLVQTGMDEGEAQIELEQSDAVRVLTVHAAKGLEFPIVCVVNTSATTRTDTTLPVLVDRDLGFGIKARAPDESFADTLARRLVCEQRSREEKAESVRLLYVAATRARDHLVVSGSLQGSGARSGTWLRWIAEQTGLDLGHPEPFAGVGVLTSPDEIPVYGPDHGLGPGELLERYREAEAALGSQGPPPALLEPIPSAPPLPSFAPTALERYLACPSSYFLTEVLGVPQGGKLSEEMPEPARIFRGGGLSLVTGTVAHRLFEEIAAITLGGERDAIERYLSEEEVADGRQREEIIESVRAMAAAFRASPFGRRVLAAAEHYSELPFVVPIGRGIVSGKIDLLYRDAGRWEILDYKTDDIDEAGLPARCARYEPQLLLYSLAAGKLLGCPPPDAWLYFARLDRPVRLAAGPDAAAGFERTIADAIDRILAGDFEPRGACPSASCALHDWCDHAAGAIQTPGPLVRADETDGTETGVEK